MKTITTLPRNYGWWAPARSPLVVGVAAALFLLCVGTVSAARHPRRVAETVTACTVSPDPSAYNEPVTLSGTGATGEFVYGYLRDETGYQYAAVGIPAENGAYSTLISGPVGVNSVEVFDPGTSTTIGTCSFNVSP